MVDLLYKEWRLAVHPVVYMFLLIGALLLVPAYPYGMVFFFGCLGLYFTSQYARENSDVLYTVLLPLPKRDVVKSKCLLFVSVELLQLLFCVPFAVLRVWTLPGGNPVGIEANAAFFGFGLMAYGVFNLLYLTLLFHPGYPVGRAFTAAIIPVSLVILGMEYAVRRPGLEWLDGLQKTELLRQLPIFAAGAAVYGACSVLAWRMAAKRFEGMDV